MFGYLKSLMTRPVRGAAAKPPRARLGLETLDRRDVPATANLVTATGALTITGNSTAETVVVTEVPQQYVTTALSPGHFVVGGVTSVTWNGVAGSPVIPVSLVKSIRAELGGGSDSFTVTRVPLMQTVVNGQIQAVPNPFVGILQSVNVNAGSGNDTVNLSAALWTPATVYGGSGDDTIRGGAGRDTLYGDSVDLVTKVVGNDNLYGGPGVDALYGGFGNDGLFAGIGDGAEILDGGVGADRYLVPSGEDTIANLASNDARITFRNSPALTGIQFAGQSGSHSFEAGSWRNSDVERVDVALANLHRRTGNTRLLETSGGAEMSFLAVGEQTSAGFQAGGWNIGTEIAFVDLPEIDTTYLQRTVYHEFGHNWDDPSENAFVADFRAVSGWIQSNTTPAGYTPSSGVGDNWQYLTSAADTFARDDYGTENPWEDMATTWEAYFVNEYHGGAAALATEELTRNDAKWETLDDLFADLR